MKIQIFTSQKRNNYLNFKELCWSLIQRFKNCQSRISHDDSLFIFTEQFKKKITLKNNNNKNLCGIIRYRHYYPHFIDKTRIHTCARTHTHRGPGLLLGNFTHSTGQFQSELAVAFSIKCRK